MTAEHYTYGQDIAATRWDRLDVACVRDAALRRWGESVVPDYAPLVVDLGCGHGLMALTLRDLGCDVIACAPMLPQALKEALGANAIQSSAAVAWESMAAPDILYSQWTLHYLPYHEAVRIIATLTRKPGASAYISLAGYNSELRYNYPHVQRPVTERFAHLAPEPRIATHISAPLCLYDWGDAAQLSDETGLAITDMWESPFGNVKLIAKRVQEITEQ